MRPVLHLSLPVRDLDAALGFYLEVLGCTAGRRRHGWADVWFHGLQLTLQDRPQEVLPEEAVGTRHFGVSLDAAAMDDLIARVEGAAVEWLVPPSVDFAGTEQEQRKAKVRDPSGNVVEIKAYRAPATALEVRRPRMSVMVGLPAAGKTTRARELASTSGALRLTPDEWMIPLFGQEQPDGVRNVLEGRLLWLALSALRSGVDVVLDFGVWAKEERSALRALAASVGATTELVYLDVDEEEQWRRVQARADTDAATTFAMTKDELARWRGLFQAPDETELRTTAVEPPPVGFASWQAWATEWWPTSLTG